MNISELHIAFKIEADKNAVNIGMSGCPSFLPEEIDYWLYTAYLSKIATKFTGNNTYFLLFHVFCYFFTIKNQPLFLA